MSDYIGYWKYFWRDLREHGPKKTFISEWHTNNERVFKNLVVGCNIWVIIQAEEKYHNEWRLLQRIRIKSLGIDTRKDKYEVQEYGPFHADGDEEHSQIFDYIHQPDFAPVLYQMEFERGRKLTARGSLIGRSFQSLRPLSIRDRILLEKYSTKLKLLNLPV